ncbi:MAG: ATP-binding cassette domain-containing protein [Treponema sp.]|jgi:simple sugar transport system ATP-binding protein|nr:ATP-binding cassette domain-containing protein [Treponema sp.]
MADNSQYASELRTVALHAVKLRGISKVYPGGRKKANNNINLDLRQGEILCIAGENGAGKTTLMKILCGLETADTGEIFINGKKEAIDSPLAAKKLGIGMVHQHFTLFGDFTAAENIVMGAEPRKWGIFFDAERARSDSEKIIRKNNFTIESTRKVKDFSLGEMQQVEICRVLYRNTKILILDEPTSILTEQETLSLFKTMKALAASGISLILITHKLHEIKQVCHRLAVLRRGEVAGIRDAADIDVHEIAHMITGEYIPHENIHQAHFAPARIPAKHSAMPVLAFENITVMRKGQKQPLLDNVSFRVGSGEILGFTGVGGNGLGVLEAVLGGFLHPSSGKIMHREKDITRFSIRRLRRCGMAYVPTDRLRVGSAGEASVHENMIINRRGEFLNGIFLNNKKINEFSKVLASGYNIKGWDEAKAAFLSGGNLQKLILAREIDWFKDYIVLCEPSWGLDIASSRLVMEEMTRLKEKGAAIIIISTNLDEITECADRIMVMYRGKIAGVFVNGDLAVKKAITDCMQLGRSD